MSGARAIPRAGYVICGQARSGSTYLCRLLRSTGALGRPDEIFQDPRTVRRLHADGAGFDALVSSVTTDNGIYGFKIFSTHFDWARKLRWAHRLPNLRYVYLERHDLLGQAISLSRAVQTRQFTFDNPSAANAAYDRRHIADCIGRLTYGAARWQGFFARNGIFPLRLVYEDVVRAPQAAISALSDHVGISPVPAVRTDQVKLAIQRDETNEEWRARFIAECGDLNYLDGGMLFSGRPGGGTASRLFLGPRARHRRKSRLSSGNAWLDDE